MQVTAAEINGSVLELTLGDAPESRREAMRFVYGFKPGDYSIAKAKKRRSTDANAYAWVLINKIADATGQANIDVYREAVRNVGGTMHMVCVEEKNADAAERMFIGDHIGRRVERLPSKLDGCVNLMLHPGSSDFDTRQMSVLIDNLLQDCKALDIETMSDREITLLLEAWNA